MNNDFIRIEYIYMCECVCVCIYIYISLLFDIIEILRFTELTENLCLSVCLSVFLFPSLSLNAAAKSLQSCPTL